MHFNHAAQRALYPDSQQLTFGCDDQYQNAYMYPNASQYQEASQYPSMSTTSPPASQPAPQEVSLIETGG